ncbi:secreted RxLR effector protein 161-like [Miscanthus floridulus]|uniref:secreted RxLR effector protein 161-like n=1 Tax=Miscanthus floridulus TaxID=154761 RepID=UPI00345A2367
MASRFMEKPTVKHLKAVKQILRYLKGTLNFGLVYTQEGKEELLVGYTNSDVGGDLVGRSTGGMAFDVNESLVTWNSHKEKIVALSSCEAEFMVAAKQALWLKNLLGELTGRSVGGRYARNIVPKPSSPSLHATSKPTVVAHSYS